MRICYVTCDDCKTEWINICGVCKKIAWQLKTVRKEKNKQPIRPVLTPKYKQKMGSIAHKEIIEFRNFWNKIHPTRVVTLIVNGHEASCRCCHALDSLTFDHIIPLDLGGSNLSKNGQILCDTCNALKDNRIISIEELQKELGI